MIWTWPRCGRTACSLSRTARTPCRASAWGQGWWAGGLGSELARRCGFEGEQTAMERRPSGVSPLCVPACAPSSCPPRHSDSIDQYVVHDPLLEAGKAKFNKQQQRAKKRQSEWAGHAQG